LPSRLELKDDTTIKLFLYLGGEWISKKVKKRLSQFSNILNNFLFYNRK
jgi:hypothetical protein